MHVFTSLVSIVFLSVISEVSGGVVHKNLPIVNKNLAPDGFTRLTTVAGGTFPGPVISGFKGDNFQINVQDQLTDASLHRATSAHWHGLFQHHTNEYDGPAFVTQCPIIPGDSFLYNFNVPDQAGTYWYHSHLSTQYCDGLRGALIIYDPKDPLAHMYDVDDDATIITLADWYHTISTVEFPATNSPVPTPDSTLINGLGRWSGNATSPLAVVNVAPGVRYRFRIVSTSCFPSYTFSIDGHNMTIIEADGTEVTPIPNIGSLNIFAAQRYSVIVTANQPIGNYWIRANPSTGTTGFTDGINSAILRYRGARPAEPTTSQNNGTLLNEANLHPLVNPGAPGVPGRGNADYNLVLHLGRNATTQLFTVNNVSFVSPNVPVLLQILSGQQNAQDLLPLGSVYPLPGNKVIEVTIPGGGNHPFHLHGHTFDVIRVSGSTVDNYVNPPRRDVVSIGGPTDNVTFRFETNNPGPWFLHCHIDWHLDAGLAIVFAEDIPDIASSNPVNSAWDQLCPSYNANNPDTAHHN